ncbi:hypothetical protein ACHAQH_009567 [Verticillium albo-atrum]
MFLSMNIQESAYGRWRAHLQGAKALIDLWGDEGLKFPDSCDFGYFLLMIADIYSITTSPSNQLSASTVTHHSSYLSMVDRLEVFSFDSFTPIPKKLIIAAISINIYRAQALGVEFQFMKDIETSATGILDYVQTFSPSAWAEQAMEQQPDIEPKAEPQQVRLSNGIDSWTCLAQSFQAATILYLIWSTPPDETKSDTDADKWATAKSSAYATLKTTIHDLFERRLDRGTHYKFILWPMLMAGLEAIVRVEHEELLFLCCSLRTVTLDLGVSAMHEAADMLERVWVRFENCEAELELHYLWDEIFADAPLFLM